MRQANVKPVLLSNTHMAAILEIQEQERKKSSIGITPSIHAIARGLVDKALNLYDHSEPINWK